MSMHSNHRRLNTPLTLSAAAYFAIFSISPLASADEEKQEADAPQVQKEGQKEVAKEDKKENKKDAPPITRLHLLNGDRLSGQPLGIDAKGNLLFKSNSLNGIATFPKGNLLSLNLGSRKPRDEGKSLARVTLQPRHAESDTFDVLTGTLSELTPESIKLDTWYGGEITLDRSMVKSFRIIHHDGGNYIGPNSIHEWHRPSGKESWSFRHGQLKSHAAGNIGRDIGMKASSHLSFFAEWDSSMRFKVRLYDDNVAKSESDNYHEISFQSTYAYLRVRAQGEDGGRNLIRGGGWKRLNVRPTKREAKFDIYTDLETGNIHIYIDRKPACVIPTQNKKPENLGPGLSFVSESRYRVSISKIAVAPWDRNTFPDASAQEDEQKQPEDGKQQIILANQDIVTGSVGKVTDGKIAIQTEYGPINIPLDRVRSLSLGNQDNQPRMLKGDVRAYFQSGGHVTLRLDSFKDGKLNGFSQAFGDASFDISAFSRIDFHIYDQDANKQRDDL